MKLGTWANSSMQNSMVLFTFSVLDQKHHFRANLLQKVKFGPKNQNRQFKLKFGT